MQNTEIVRLAGWGPYEDVASSILPRMFGELLQRAEGVVVEYQSDLYHDAQWLRDNLAETREFDFVVRHSGTSIGPMARVVKEINRDAILYHVSVDADERGQWFATFTREEDAAPGPVADELMGPAPKGTEPEPICSRCENVLTPDEQLDGVCGHHDGNDDLADMLIDKAVRLLTSVPGEPDPEYLRALVELIVTATAPPEDRTVRLVDAIRRSLLEKSGKSGC